VNTFAIIALAWLLYLATKGKLVEFADLAVSATPIQKELAAGGITMSNISSELSNAKIAP
jgi:hypothetical protein